MKPPRYFLQQSPDELAIAIELGPPAAGDDSVPIRASDGFESQALAEFGEALASAHLLLEWRNATQRSGFLAQIVIRPESKAFLDCLARRDPPQFAYFLADEVFGKSASPAVTFLSECFLYDCAGLSDPPCERTSQQGRWYRELAHALLETSIPFRFTPPLSMLREHLESLLADNPSGSV